MARIPMTSGFELIPEGWDVFRVLSAVYKEEFGKIEVTLVNAKGLKHVERFSLKKSNGEWNDKALGAFSYFAKTCLDDFSAEEIDPEELVGHYIKAEVTHDEVESNKGDGKMLTFAHLGKKEVAYQFDEEPSKRTVELFADIDHKSTATESTSEEGTGLDLDSILGDLPF